MDTVVTYGIPLLAGATWIFLFLMFISVIYKLTERWPIFVVFCYLPLQAVLHALHAYHLK